MLLRSPHRARGCSSNEANACEHGRFWLRRATGEPDRRPRSPLAGRAARGARLPGPACAHRAAGVPHRHSRVLNAPAIHQSMPLDCESAATWRSRCRRKRIRAAQAWVFAAAPEAAAARDRLAGSVRWPWGDPYCGVRRQRRWLRNQLHGVRCLLPTDRSGRPACRCDRSGSHRVDNEPDRVPDPAWSGGRLGQLQLRLLSGPAPGTQWDGRVVPYTTEEHTVTVDRVQLRRRHRITVIDVGVGTRWTDLRPPRQPSPPSAVWASLSGSPARP